jgi:hypothetical protein
VPSGRVQLFVKEFVKSEFSPLFSVSYETVRVLLFRSKFTDSFGTPGIAMEIS